MAFVIVTLKSIENWVNNNKQTKLSVVAKVIDIDGRNARKINRNGIVLNPSYRITFSMQNEKRIITVPAYGNEWIKLGHRGVLTLQGTRFIKFEISKAK